MKNNANQSTSQQLRAAELLAGLFASIFEEYDNLQVDISHEITGEITLHVLEPVTGAKIQAAIQKTGLIKSILYSDGQSKLAPCKLDLISTMNIKTRYSKPKKA